MCKFIFKTHSGCNDIFLIQQYISQTFKSFIPRFNNEINKNQLSEEKNKLIEQNNEKDKKLLNEINRLKTELEKYKIENENLKSNLAKANKIIDGLQKNQITNSNNKEIKILKDENKNLKEQLNLRVNEINQLKLKIQNNGKEDELVNIKDIMVINFISTDSSIHCGIKCLPTYTFAKVEEELYQHYDDFRNTNNVLTVNAKPILRFKTIKENNIHDGDIVQLIKVE